MQMFNILRNITTPTDHPCHENPGYAPEIQANTNYKEQWYTMPGSQLIMR